MKKEPDFEIQQYCDRHKQVWWLDSWTPVRKRMCPKCFQDKCKHQSKYANWEDKFIPKIKGKLLTKYWSVKCRNCKLYVPEYGFKYPRGTFTK